jgi:hypothetical protein
VLARRVAAALVAALVGVATLALEEELHVLAPAEPTHGSGVTRHLVVPSVFASWGVEVIPRGRREA